MLPGPMPSSTPCAVPTPATVKVAWPSTNLAITPQSATNFAHFDPDGHGRMFVIVYFDGTKRALIRPTRDIDAELGTALSAYVDKIVVSPTVACGNAAAVFAMQFEVPSGVVHYVVVPAPHTQPSASASP